MNGRVNANFHNVFTFLFIYFGYQYSGVDRGVILRQSKVSPVVLFSVNFVHVEYYRQTKYKPL